MRLFIYLVIAKTTSPDLEDLFEIKNKYTEAVKGRDIEVLVEICRDLRDVRYTRQIQCNKDGLYYGFSEID